MNKLLLRTLRGIAMLLAVASSTFTRMHAQISSNRVLPTGTSIWFDAGAWDNGVPNGPGDMANLKLVPRASSSLELPASVTLEQLDIRGYFSINLFGQGPLLFRSDGTGDVSLVLSAQTGLLTTTVSTPVSLSGSEPLYVITGVNAVLQWNGSIISTVGDVVKQGAGSLQLAGNNTGWGGNLVLEGGDTTITSNAALGTSAGGVTIRKGSNLTLAQSTADPLSFEDGTLHIQNMQLSGPVSLIGRGVIHRPQNPLITDRGLTFETTLGQTTISSAISGSGDLLINNQSRDALNLSGENSYTGRTYIIAGNVYAANSNSLGTADGGTTVQGGSLIIQAPTDDEFRVEGGSLDFAAGTFVTPHPITLSGGQVRFPNVANITTPIVVAAPGGEITGRSSTTSYSGGATGVGSLSMSFLTLDAPLNHAGDLVLKGVTLNVPNYHSGSTRLTGDAVINHPGAFGQSSNVRVQNGTLTLNVLPNGAPEYIVERGTLYIPNALPPITSAITLGGTYDAFLSGQGIFDGPIHLAAQTSSGQNTILSGTVNGPIAGKGGLRLGGASDSVVNLNGTSNIAGLIEVSGGTVNVNNSHALNFHSTVVSGGRLNLNVPTPRQVITNQSFSSTGTVAFNVPQSYAEPWVLNAGTLEASARVNMAELIVLQGTMRGAGSGGFGIDGNMNVVRSGTIEGGLKGNGAIHLLGSELRASQDLSKFTGDFHVHTGLLNLSVLGSGFTSATSLNPETDFHVYNGGTLLLTNGTSSGDVIIDNDIFLHNANRGAAGYSSALTRLGNGSNILRGRVDVGDQGSTIYGGFQIEGVLTGRNLTIDGGGLLVTSNQDQLRGTLRLNQAGLNFEGLGAIQGVDRIQIKKGGTLNFAPSSNADRMDDATQIVSEGGHISLYSDLNLPTSETLGNVHLKQGTTRIVVSSDHNSRSAGLTIRNLARDPGSILLFIEAGFRNSTRILDYSNLNYGIIGPWAVTANGFATLDASGNVKTLTATSTDFEAAGPNDHVQFSGAHTLAADKAIASLYSTDNENLNLGGYELTVRSGGIFRVPDIINGRLTAGDSGAAELIIHQANRLSADIVDNAGGGPVSLVVSSTNLRVSGHNSYSGGTWVTGSEYYPGTNAKLTIDSLSAIPAHDRVHVDNATYEMQPLSGGEARLDELYLRNGGYVSGSFLTPLNVRQMFVEDGLINALLQGDGAIVKRTDGAVDFSNSKGDNFTGTVTVQDGILSVQHRTLPHATFVVEGGQLNLTSDGNSSSNIVLKGGTLGAGYLMGTVNVQTDSTIAHNDYTRVYGTLAGSGNLTIRGRQDDAFGYFVGLFGDAAHYSGNIRVESGALRVGTPGSAGTGVITVEAAGRLILGSNTYTDSPTRMSNEVHVEGGTLYSTPPWNLSIPGIASPSEFTGRVYVHHEGFIGALRNGVQGGKYVPGLTFAGQLLLEDDARVYGLSDGRSSIDISGNSLVAISGELRVGAHTTWNLLTSSLAITGTVRPLGAVGSIDFEGIPGLLQMSGATLQVDSGQSLSVTINGQSVPVELSGMGNALQGSGILQGDYVVDNGAAVSPGNSSGLLTIDGNTTFGTSGHLSIELAGLMRGNGYDALDVRGDVLINGGLLDVSLLGGFTPTSADRFVILRGRHITGHFANAANSILVGGQNLPITYFDDMVVLGNPIPEPTCPILVLLLAATCACGRERRLERGSWR